MNFFNIILVSLLTLTNHAWSYEFTVEAPPNSGPNLNKACIVEYRRMATLMDKWDNPGSDEDLDAVEKKTAGYVMKFLLKPNYWLYYGGIKAAVELFEQAEFGEGPALTKFANEIYQRDVASEEISLVAEKVRDLTYECQHRMMPLTGLGVPKGYAGYNDILKIIKQRWQ